MTPSFSFSTAAAAEAARQPGDSDGEWQKLLADFWGAFEDMAAADMAFGEITRPDGFSRGSQLERLAVELGARDSRMGSWDLVLTWALQDDVSEARRGERGEGEQKPVVSEMEGADRESKGVTEEETRCEDVGKESSRERGEGKPEADDREGGGQGTELSKSSSSAQLQSTQAGSGSGGNDAGLLQDSRLSSEGVGEAELSVRSDSWRGIAVDVLRVGLLSCLLEILMGGKEEGEREAMQQGRRRAPL